MQKKLIALAVAAAAGAISAPVYAQSQVQVYGIIDVGVESGKYSDAVGNLTRMTTSGNMTNRLGFKGSEDLGNGMKANFMLELQPYPDVGTAGVSGTVVNSNLFHRTSTVGLSGNWGAVNLGNQYTPWFSARAANDIFNVAGVGSNYVSMELGNTRMSNSIRYDSANFNGFTFAAMYGFGQAVAGVAPAPTGAGAFGAQEGTTAGNKNAGKDVSLNVMYGNGPLALRYGYDNYKATQGPDANVKNNNVNGSYDFKIVKLVLGWNSRKSDNTTVVNIDNKSWYVGGVMPVFGKDFIKAEYTRFKDNTATAATGSMDAHLLAIGYEHNMSKRTALYGTYSKLNNDTGATHTFLSDNGVGVAAGYDPSAFQMGIRHMF